MASSSMTSYEPSAHRIEIRFNDSSLTQPRGKRILENERNSETPFNEGQLLSRKCEEINMPHADKCHFCKATTLSSLQALKNSQCLFALPGEHFKARQLDSPGRFSSDSSLSSSLARLNPAWSSSSLSDICCTSSPTVFRLPPRPLVSCDNPKLHPSA
jgi:hypothetical protein